MIRKDYLTCPVCSSSFAFSNGEKSLTCSHHHNYDIAKQGYINFCGSSMGKVYENRELFRARRNVYDAGFFKGVEESVADSVGELFANDGSVIVEAGCGEGSFLAFVEQRNPGNQYIGLDISKYAIKMAAQRSARVCWLVADICKMPIKSGSVDCIIDMLTPANYAEFNRVLKPGAHIIKIIPNDNYLVELRQKLGLKSYENKGVDRFFSRHFALLTQKRVKYVFPCDKSVQEDIYRMTPMTSGRNEYGSLEKVGSITLDLSVLVGRKKEAG